MIRLYHINESYMRTPSRNHHLRISYPLSLDHLCDTHYPSLYRSKRSTRIKSHYRYHNNPLVTNKPQPSENEVVESANLFRPKPSTRKAEYL